MTASGLVVDDLTIGYQLDGGRIGHAVRGVSLTIAPGESLALVGESGCGKSTIALAVTRLLPPNASTGGAITLDGTDVVALQGSALRRWWTTDVAMVFQEPGAALNPTMRVGAQVAEALRVLGADKATARQGADALLERVALDPDAIRDRYPHQLSGGQQQRVIIAIALAVQPRLLVLDEPTTGLDATVEAGVLRLVRDLRRELSSSVLYITHDLGIVPTVADRVAVLYAGEVVEHGDVATVLARPEHPYTRALMDAVPTSGHTKHHGNLATIPGTLPSVGDEIAGCAFAARCGFADAGCRVSPIALVTRADARGVRCRRVDDVVASSGAPEQPAPVEPAREPARAAAPVGAEGGATALLELAGVTKRFGDVVAVDDVSLQVGSSEVLGLVGASGSGKSTIARLVTGLSAPDAGQVLLEGVALDPDVRRRTRAQRLSLQMVFQSPDATLNPRHRVGAILSRAIEKLGGSRTAAELAAEVRLDPALLDRRAANLSGGQKQRVAIARAIAGDPALVVCDEPVSALDVSVQAGILTLLADLQRRRGTALLFISHDLAVVEYIADRVAVMHGGRIVDEGDPADVLRDPTHHYTRELVEARSALADVDQRFGDGPLETGEDGFEVAALPGHGGGDDASIT